MVMAKGYQVFEFSSYGGKHPVSKVYPTWLGCKRSLNKIRREFSSLVGYSYKIIEV